MRFQGLCEKSQWLPIVGLVFCWLFSMERDMGSLVLLRDSVCLSLNLPPKICHLNSESEVTIILKANCVS